MSLKSWLFGRSVRIEPGEKSSPQDAERAVRAVRPGHLIGNVYTNDPHVAAEALRADNVVRSTMEMPRPVDRRRLEACVKRWRGLAECYSQNDVRDAILVCARDLQHTLDGTP
jgi:hypothetical protein